MSVIRAAVVQHAPVFLDLEASVDKALALIGEAAGNAADLVVFGETWLPCYPAWIFGSAEWDDTASKRAYARHVAAWPESSENHHIASRHYAFEGRCFVICASTFLTADMIPPELKETRGADALQALSRAEGVLFPGGSGVIGPDGGWIAGPAGDEETIVYGEMDLARIGEEFQALDTAGHYNRPDVFQLTVDARPREQVVWVDGERADAADGAARGARPRRR